MAEFPRTFTEEPKLISAEDIARVFPHLAAPFIELESQQTPIRTYAGLPRRLVPALKEISEQEGTRRYCPGDIEHRWGNEDMAERQLAKDGGRGVVLFVPDGTKDVAAYGWTGASGKVERMYLPDCVNTFSLRVNESFRGRGLARLASAAIVAVSMAEFDADRIGLQTWKSNVAAVKAYERAGAVLIAHKEDTRPTLIRNDDPDSPCYDTFSSPDTRLFMQFTQSFPASPE